MIFYLPFEYACLSVALSAIAIAAVRFGAWLIDQYSESVDG